MVYMYTNYDFKHKVGLSRLKNTGNCKIAHLCKLVTKAFKYVSIKYGGQFEEVRLYQISV